MLWCGITQHLLYLFTWRVKKNNTLYKIVNESFAHATFMVLQITKRCHKIWFPWFIYIPIIIVSRAGVRKIQTFVMVYEMVSLIKPAWTKINYKDTGKIRLEVCIFRTLEGSFWQLAFWFLQCSLIRVVSELSVKKISRRLKWLILIGGIQWNEFRIIFQFKLHFFFI